MFFDLFKLIPFGNVFGNKSPILTGRINLKIKLH